MSISLYLGPHLYQNQLTSIKLNLTNQSLHSKNSTSQTLQLILTYRK